MVCSLCSYYARRKIHNVSQCYISVYSVIYMRMMYAVQMIIITYNHLSSYKYIYVYNIHKGILYCHLPVVACIFCLWCSPVRHQQGDRLREPVIGDALNCSCMAGAVHSKGILKHHAIFCLAKIVPVSLKTLQNLRFLATNVSRHMADVGPELWHCAMLPIAWNPAHTNVSLLRHVFPMYHCQWHHVSPFSSTVTSRLFWWASGRRTLSVKGPVTCIELAVAVAVWQLGLGSVVTTARLGLGVNNRKITQLHIGYTPVHDIHPQVAKWDVIGKGRDC